MRRTQTYGTIPSVCVFLRSYDLAEVKDMSRRRNLLLSAAAALLTVLLVYGINVMLVRQVELQEQVEVVVPKSFIQTGTLLAADMLEMKPIASGSFREGMLRSKAAAVGMEAIVPLGTSEPILEWKLDRFHLLPGGNQSTFHIPKSYIMSLPGGIRAGDRVRLYVSDPEGSSRRLFDHDVVVASVKSSSNTEVDDPEHSNLLSKAQGDREKMYVSRREANGTIDQINLNLTEEEWLTIDQICKAGKVKLTIAFTAASIVGNDGAMPGESKPTAGGGAS